MGLSIAFGSHEKSRWRNHRNKARFTNSWETKSECMGNIKGYQWGKYALVGIEFIDREDAMGNGLEMEGNVRRR